MPIAAYQVSGEYYMLKMASLNEIFNYKKCSSGELKLYQKSWGKLDFFIFTEVEALSEWLKD